MEQTEKETNRDETGENTFDSSLVQRDSRGRFLSQGGPGRKEKAETVVLRRLKERLPEGAEQAVEVLISQLTDDNKRIRQGAAKILLERVVPIQILQKTWQQAEDKEETNHSEEISLLGEFIKWRFGFMSLEQLQQRAIDAGEEINPVHQVPHTDNDQPE
jgi:hypothetical protein